MSIDIIVYTLDNLVYCSYNSKLLILINSGSKEYWGEG